MSFLDKVGNRVDKMRSKQNENSDIGSYNKQIKEQKDAIDLLITEIGEYYWNRYANDDLEPPEDVVDLFKEVAERVDSVNSLKGMIEERKEQGEKQREEIDIKTKETEERKAAEAEERRRQREEAKRIAAEEKAAEEMTSSDEDKV